MRCSTRRKCLARRRKRLRTKTSKGLLCKLSRKGRRLYDKAIMEVRRRQAAMILQLDPHEREVTYIALKKLYSACMNANG